MIFLYCKWVQYSTTYIRITMSEANQTEEKIKQPEPQQEEEAPKEEP